MYTYVLNYKIQLSAMCPIDISLHNIYIYMYVYVYIYIDIHQHICTHPKLTKLEIQRQLYTLTDTLVPVNSSTRHIYDTQ